MKIVSAAVAAVTVSVKKLNGLCFTVHMSMYIKDDQMQDEGTIYIVFLLPASGHP